MPEAVTTETRMLEDNEGKPFYLHIEYDKWGNPIRRQVSRFADPDKNLDWLYQNNPIKQCSKNINLHKVLQGNYYNSAGKNNLHYFYINPGETNGT